ncbi:SurA N-terminal domain-containing protein [Deferrisoma palaeochoriense]
MLNQIRKNVRNPYVQAVLGLIILVFIFFFGWGVRSQKPAYVAKVNGTEIDLATYQRAYGNLAELYRQAYGERWNARMAKELGLARRALDQLIDQALLLQEADRRGIEVTDEELAAAIQAVGAFQEGGRFSKQRYLQLLDANRITPLEYEQSTRRELLLRKVEQAIRAQAQVTDAEIEAEYRDRNTKARISFVAFRPEAFEPQVEVTDEALAEYYEAQKEQYRTPERRSARYVLFAPEAFEKDVEVTDEEIRQEYNWRAGEFAEKEAVRARHILVRLPQNASEDEEKAARERIEKIRKQIEEGADFAELAKKVSEDPGSKDKGGDLGYFERGKMVPEFEKVAFSLEPGQVSEPVRTPFGYHLIRVEDHREARQKPLEEVRDQIERDIRRRKALELAFTAADNTLMDLEDGKVTWEDLAKDHEVKTTPLLAKTEPVPGVAKPEEFREVLFSLEPGQPGEVLETPQGTYLIALAELKPAEVPPLEDVRDQVEAAYRKQEAVRLARKKAEEFLATAREKGWDEALKASGLTAETTDPFVKKGGAVPKIGWSPELKEAVFGLEPGQVAEEPFEVNGKIYAVRLEEKIEPDMAGLEAEREKIRAELLAKKQEQVFEEYLQQLRKEAEIEINEDLVRLEG